MHDHVWVPIDGEVARYACACGQEAVRSGYTGKFREVSTRRVTREVTARPTADVIGFGDLVTVDGSSVGVSIRYEMVSRKRGA